MRHLLATALAAGTLAFIPATAPAAPCTQAKIEGQSKCIARGQFCKRSARAMRDYRRYGLSCTKRDRNGRYHLQ
jgi:hypothetical protein